MQIKEIIHKTVTKADQKIPFLNIYILFNKKINTRSKFEFFFDLIETF